jgi:polar amino acid transport system ATP-binding protein
MLLKIENLYKNYGKTAALTDINLEVGVGEQVVFLGASGSGKSTLLRCINYLEVPDSGTVWLDGETIGGKFDDQGRWRTAPSHQVAQQRREIGMVFQGFHLFAHLKVLDNVAIGPQKVLKKPKAACRELARYFLDKVHLGHHANKFPAQLSGGEQQRVAIARALAMNPKLLLFDEPTSALDPCLTHEVLQVIQELAEEGMTMLIVTHEIPFAQRVADRVVFMEHGRIVEVGATETFFTRPHSSKTQKFLSYVL